MKLKRSAFLIMLALCLPNIIAQKADVKLKLKKGDTYSVTMNMDNNIDQEMMGQQIQMEQKMMMTLEMRVLDKLSNGNYKMEQQYTRLKMDMVAMGQNVSMDTDGERDAQNEVLHKMKEVAIGFEVSPKGEVSNVTGFDEFMEAISQNAQASQMMKGISNKDMVKNFFGYIPQEKVNVGSSFVTESKLESAMGAEVKTTYAVKDLQKNKMDLSISSDISFSPDKPLVQNGMTINLSGSGDQTGSFGVNLKDGMPAISNMTQNMEMKMSFTNPQSGEDMTMPMKLKSTVVTTVVKN